MVLLLVIFVWLVFWGGGGSVDHILARTLGQPLTIGARDAAQK
jgi:hypothetical protein